nr:unknown [Ipomoea trifida]
MPPSPAAPRRGSSGGGFGEALPPERNDGGCCLLSQAAHFRASGVPSSPPGINSPHPSITCPPMLAAWFLRHALYLTEEFPEPLAEVSGSTCGGATAALLPGPIGRTPGSGSGFAASS